MISRWPVRVEVPIDAGDCDDAGRLSDAGVERVFAVARAAYFDLCRTIDPGTLEIRRSAVRHGEAKAGSGVSVSVNVTEVFPDTFTMAARIRSESGDVSADALCALSPGGTVTDAMRDEFIALAHGATHMS